MNTVFTFGYAGSTHEALKAYVDELGALLVDIRFAPYSKDERWRIPALRGLVGVPNYVWIQQLGNKNYKNGLEIELFNPEAGAERLKLALARRPVILMCGCWNVETCHRKVAAEFMGERLGAPVQHLAGKYAPVHTRGSDV